jgi:hypothetical protein
MGAFLRLWQRAPLWRWILVGTAAAAVMTVAFPPGGSVPAPAPTVPAATESPPTVLAATESPPVALPKPEPAVPPNANLPTAGASYAARLPLGAQSVPLPPGRWVALAVNNPNPPKTPPSVDVFLARILGGRVVAAALISGSIVPDPRQAGFPAPLEAQIPSFYYRRVLSAVDHGALDLWVCGNTVPARWTDPLRQAAVGVIHQQNITLTDHLDSVVFRFADTQNWMSADFMFTDPAATTDPVPPWTEAAVLSDTGPLSHLEKVRRWGKAWHDIMRSGFTGVLRSGDELHIAPP